MKNEENIDIKKNYLQVLKSLEELIQVSKENNDYESERFFKRALLLTRTGVLKIERKKSKESN
tara:strand:+ start:301 stop:489 length:189 start_codon:yes stop_codon:yes gene_type:complete